MALDQLTPCRKGGRDEADEFNRRFQAAIEALDVVPAGGTIDVRHAGREPVVALVRKPRKPGRHLALLTRLGPLRVLFEPAARMLAPWVARAARRRTGVHHSCR